MIATAKDLSGVSIPGDNIVPHMDSRNIDGQLNIRVYHLLTRTILTTQVLEDLTVRVRQIDEQRGSLERTRLSSSEVLLSCFQSSHSSFASQLNISWSIRCSTEHFEIQMVLDS